MKKQLMRVKGRILLAALMIASTAAGALTQAASSPEADIALIKSRLVAQYVGGMFADAGRFLVSQASDGSWSDINYVDRSLNWDPQKHLDRLKQMAIAYRSEKSPDRGAPNMREGIARGLAFWYQRKPSADNWWSNEIGQQLALEPILIL